MLQSILNHSNNKNDNGDVLNNMLSNLLSGQNAKVTIKIEAGKSRNQRDEAGVMQSDRLQDGYSPDTMSMMDDLTGGGFSSEGNVLDGGASPNINRSPYANDVLGNLLGGGGVESSKLPFELLLALASQINPYSGSISSPSAGKGDLLQALLGGGAPPGVGTMPTPPVAGGLPFMEGMPGGGMPPGLPPELAGGGLPPELAGALPPELAGGMPSPNGVPLPPMPTGGEPQGGGMEELLKMLMGGRA